MGKGFGKSGYRQQQNINRYLQNIRDKVESQYSSIDSDNIEEKNAAMDQIAKFDKNRFNSFLANLDNVMTIIPTKPMKKQSPYTNVPEVKNRYSTLFNDGWFDEFNNMIKSGTSKYNTSSNFMKKVIQLDADKLTFSHTNLKNISSLTDVVSALKKFKNDLANGKPFITFDTEATGGIANSGYDVLHNFQEFSFSINMPEKDKPLATITNIVGLSNKEHEDAIKKLDSINSRIGTDRLTSDESVFLQRWALAGHPKTKFTGNTGEFEGDIFHYTDFAEKEDLRSLSVDELKQYAKTGIDNALRIRNAQTAATNGGTPTIVNQIREAVDYMNGGVFKDDNTGKSYENMSVVGYNSKQYDLFKIGLGIANTPGLKDLNINIPTQNNLDVYEGVRYLNDYFGSNSLIDLSNTIKGEGPATQTQIANAILGSVAHTDSNISDVRHAAFADEQRLKNVVTNNNFINKLYDSLSGIANSDTTIAGKYAGPNKQLFYMTQSNFFKFGNNRGALSFGIDPVTRSIITEDGYEMKKDVNGARQIIGNAVASKGTKKRGLYTTDIVKIENSDEFKKLYNISGLEEFSGNNMWAAIFTPVGSNTKYEPTVVKVAARREDIQSILNNAVEVGSNINPAGNIKDITNYKANKENLDKLKFYTIADTTVEDEKTTNVPVVQKAEKIFSSADDKLKFLGEQADLRYSTEAASNSIRTMSLKKYKNIKKAYTELKSNASGAGYAKDGVIDTDKYIADLIANNKPLTLAVQDGLEYFDYYSGQNVIRPGSIRNALVSQPYMESIMPMFDYIQNQIESDIQGDDSATQMKQEEAFHNAINQVYDFIAENNTNPNDMNKAFNRHPVAMLEGDTNYIELNIDEVLNTKNMKDYVLPEGLFDQDKNIRRLYLGNSSGKQLQNFLKTQHNDSSIDMNKDTGYSDIEDFIFRLNKTKEFNNAINVSDPSLKNYIDINQYKYGNYGQTSGETNDSIFLYNRVMDEITNFTNKKRESERSFGFKNGQYFTDVTTSIESIQNLIQSTNGSYNIVNPELVESIKSGIQRAKDNTYVILDKNIESTARTLVMNNMGFSEVEKKLQALTKNSAMQDYDKTILNGNYKSAYDSMLAKAMDLLKGTKLSNIQIMTKRDGTVVAQHGDRQIELILPKIGLNNGVLHIDNNGNRSTIMPTFNVDNIIRNGFSPTNVKYGTSLSESLNKSYSFEYALKNSVNHGEDVLGTLDYMMKRTRRNIMEGSIPFESINKQVLGYQREFDFGPLVSILPELFDSGVIENLQNSGRISKDVDLRSIFTDKILNTIRDKRDVNNYRSVEDLMSAQKLSMIQDIGLPLIHYIGENLNDDAGFKSLKTLALNANYGNKDTHVIKSHGGQRPGDPLSDWYNNIKPTVTQEANKYSFNKKKFDERIAKSVELNGKLTTGSILTNNDVAAVIDDESGQEYTSTVTGLSLAIDPENFHKKIMSGVNAKEDNAVEKELAKLGLKPGENPEMEDFIREKLKGLSLYEQEIVITKDFYDTVMHDTYVQQIKSKKMIEILTSNARVTSNNVMNSKKLGFKITDDGKIEYNSGFHVGAKKYIFSTNYNGVEKDHISKYAGHVKGAFFDNTGNIVTPETLQKDLAGHNVTNTKEAMDILKKKYNFNYYITHDEDYYGAKLFIGREKGATNPLLMPIGLTDFSKGILKKAGFEDYQGKYVSNDFIQSNIAGKISDKDLTKLNKELSVLSEVYLDIVDPERKGIVATHSLEIAKHGHTATSILDIIQRAKPIIKDDEEAFNKLNNVFEGELKYDSKTGELSLGNYVNKPIHLNELKKFEDEYKEQLGSNILEDGTGYRMYGDMAHIIDHPGITSRGYDPVGESRRRIAKIRSGIDDVKQKIQAEKEELRQKYIGNSRSKNQNELYSSIQQMKKNRINNKNNLVPISDSNHDTTVYYSDLIRKINSSNLSDEQKKSLTDWYNIKLNNRMTGGLDVVKSISPEVNKSFYDTLSTLSKEKRSVEDLGVDISKEYNKLAEAKLNNILESKDKIKGYRKNLIDKYADLEEEKNTAYEANEISRGFKYSSRLDNILKSKVWNDNYINETRSRLNDDALFKSIFQDFTNEDNGVFTVKDEYKGKPVLDPFLNLMRDKIRNNEGDFKLSDLDEGGAISTERLRSKYGYLLGKYDKNMSVNTAENSYVYAAGQKSVAFNNGIISNDQLVNDNDFGFRKVNIENIEADITGEADSLRGNINSVHHNNLLIDFGDRYGKDRRFLSVSRSKDSQFEDMMVTPEHIRLLKQMSDIAKDLEGKKYTSQKEISDAEARMMQLQDRYKEAEIKSMSGKKSAIADAMAVRLNQSSQGKASGIHVYDPHGSFDELKAYNPDVLSKAKFEGKSILEHYSQGRYIDAQFRGEEFFENMGYFDTATMNKRLETLAHNDKALEELKFTSADITKIAASEDVNQKKEVMKNVLSTFGDMFLIDRAPDIREGSGMPALIYYDKTVMANQAKTMTWTEKAMKADHDGDTIAAARIANGINGSYIDELLKVKQGANEQRANLVKTNKAFMMHRASVDNPVYVAQVQDQMNSYSEKLLKGNDYLEMAKEDILDGKLYGALSFNKNMTEEKVFASIKRSHELLSPLTNEFIKNNKSLVGEEYNKEAIKKIKELSSKEDLNNNLEDFSIDRRYLALKTEISAKDLKSTVGEINTPLFKERKLFDILADHNSKYYNDSLAILQGVSYQFEEGGISAKKIGDSIHADLISNWNNAMMGLYKGKNVTNNLNVLRSTLNNNTLSNISKDTVQYLENTSSMLKEQLAGMKTNEEKGKYIINRYIGIMKSIATSQYTRQLTPTMSIGNTLNGATVSSIVNPILADTDNSLEAEALRAGSYTALNITKKLKGNEYLEDDIKSRLHDGREWIKNEAEESGQVIKKVVQSIGEKFSTMKGKNMALGALGLAGGLVAAGYIGGNPSRPADTQAAEDADASDFYNVPDLYGQQNVSPNKQQGYVINIDANSKHGSQKIQRIIQQAVQQSIPVDLNVSMNIKDNGGNISDRKIENIVSGFFN